MTAQERYEHVITKHMKWIVIHELIDKGILIKENVRKYKIYKLNLDNKKVKELLDFIFDNPAFVIE
jgi:predicted transcriptional regulator with HTH domain